MHPITGKCSTFSNVLATSKNVSPLNLLISIVLTITDSNFEIKL